MKNYLALLLSAVVLASGCSDQIVGELEAPDMSRDIEATWNTVHDVYPFFQMKHINWDSVHTVYTPRAERARGDEILPILVEMLSGLRDGHVTLSLPSGMLLSTYRPPRSQRDAALYDPFVVRKYFGGQLAVSSDKMVEYGALPESVGYIRLNTFVHGSWESEFPSALESLQNIRGLVIDVRNNGGGSTGAAGKVICRFIDAPLAEPPLYHAGHLQTSSFVQPWGPRYTGRVAVLINGACFSSTEYFAEMMKQIPSVVVIGDTTGGGGGIPEVLPLPSGAVLRIPTGEYRRYDGVPTEWNGIPPTTRVENSAVELSQGKDSQLEYAIQLLR